MDIMELGAIGELVGGVAVIGSLIYVGLQIRQSARVTHSANHQTSMMLWRDLTAPLHSDAELSALFIRGLDDDESLSREEKVRMHFLLLQLVLFYKDTFDAWEADILDTATFEAWEGFIASVLAKPGGRSWWHSAHGLYIEKVRRRIDEAVEIATPYDTLEFLRT